MGSQSQPVQTKLSSKALTILVRLIVSGVSMLPIRIRSEAGALLGKLAWLIPSKERYITTLQLKLFLGSSFASLGPMVFEQFGRSLLESLNLAPILKDVDKHITCDELDVVHKLRSNPKGLVVLTGHTSNWDLMAAYFIKKGFEIHAIGRPARNQALQPLLDRMRASYGLKVIWKSGQNSLKEIITLLINGRIVAGLIDQDTRAKSVYVPFFGKLTKTPSTMVELAKKYQLPVVACFIFRIGPLKFRTFLRQLDPSKTTEEVLRDYHEFLEELLRQYPEQWVWFHKRWRSFPNDTTLGSKDYIKYLENECANA